MSRAWLLLIFVFALDAGGCAGKAPQRPDPIPEEWERAVEETVAAPAVGKTPGAQPKLVNPVDGVVLTAEALALDHDVVVFSWSQSSWNSSYTLEVAVDRNFKQIVLRKTVPRNTFAYRMSRNGLFYWRVRTDAALISNVHQFSVSR